jgi:hypothetical protein
MAKPTLNSCEDNKISNEDLVAERLDDVLAVGATSVADLDNLTAARRARLSAS